MNAALTLGYGQVSGFPAGSAVASILLAAVGALPANATPVTQQVAPGTASVTFSSLPADTWTFSATPLDANNNALTASGYSVPTGSVTLTAPSTVTLSVPTTLSATQA